MRKEEKKQGQGRSRARGEAGPGEKQGQRRSRARGEAGPGEKQCAEKKRVQIGSEQKESGIRKTCMKVKKGELAGKKSLVGSLILWYG